MLILRRAEGQWVEVRHRSGDVLRVRFSHIAGPPDGGGADDGPAPPRGELRVAFLDDPRQLEILRGERLDVDPRGAGS